MKREAVRAPLAVQPITRDVLKEKYLKEGEQDVDELFARVAAALASVEAQDRRAHWQARFHANLRRGAIGAGLAPRPTRARPRPGRTARRRPARLP